MIYEKLPDTVEAVKITIDGDNWTVWPDRPKWFTNMINGTGRMPFIMIDGGTFTFFDTGSRTGKSHEEYYIERIQSGNWFVCDENGRIDIYDDSTFYRKFKKVT